MRFEVAFVAAYAVVLLAVAVGLERLGRVSSSAWSSRLLAAYRAQVPDAPEPATHADWPHSEVPRLHTVLAAVASTAATLLCVAEGARHHAPGEAVLLGVVAALAATVTLRRLRRLRAASGPE